MSQIVTRKGPVGEDKDKRQTDSPVKEMKKKIAANAEKEKQAAEKSVDKSALNEKKAEKPAEKSAEKSTEKKDKNLDKSLEKKEKTDKSEKKETSDKKENNVEKTSDKKDKTSDKKEKPADKKEKPADKKETQAEKVPAEKEKEKIDKPENQEDKPKPTETAKAKENGALNGDQNGDTVSSEDEHESDEMFPELAYDDSDGDFEPPTPEGPSRSLTRRSQVKATRTPETPRPASEKNDKDYVPDDSKLLKLKDDTPSSDRRLRSSDSPKPQDKKMDKVQDKKSDSPKKDLKSVEEEPASEIKTCDVVIEIVNEDESRVKSDTNYSKSRVKVSPYRRSARADHTDTSLLANYTGNNTTMEMDITESSLISEEQPESPYLSGLRSIRARRSYKPLKEMSLRNISVNRSARSVASVNEAPSRPTGTVVGRKRRQEADVEVAAEASEGGEAHKRPRLLERLARPFRLASTPLPARRNAEIVGINTDLPLSAPVASSDTFDPEAIKPTDNPTPTPVPTLPTVPTPTERDSKRCAIM